MENNQSAARQAKRFLDDRVRNDWAYPAVPPPWSASDEEVRDAQDFRERYYGESESSDSDHDHDEDAAGPYRFDNPESIGDAVAHTRHARKRRRRARLEEEMVENEGLRIWVERRDLWTGASSVKKYGTRRRSKPNASGAVAGEEVKSSDSQEPTPTYLPDSPPMDRSGSNADALDTFDIIPVAPRLLASNPIRASINPKAYSDIFQKIVVSARTPSVPINLADMTKALVQGWKDSDEWPPKVSALDPLAGGKKRSSGVAGVVNGSAHGGGHGAGFIGRHPHLEKSVDSVKRILHINGHAHHGPETPEGGKEG